MSLVLPGFTKENPSGFYREENMNKLKDYFSDGSFERHVVIGGLYFLIAVAIAGVFGLWK